MHTFDRATHSGSCNEAYGHASRMHHACLKILLECGHRVHRDGLYFHVLVHKQAVYVVYLVSRRMLTVRFGSTWYSCTAVNPVYTVWTCNPIASHPGVEIFLVRVWKY